MKYLKFEIALSMLKWFISSAVQSYDRVCSRYFEKMIEDIAPRNEWRNQASQKNAYFVCSEQKVEFSRTGVHRQTADEQRSHLYPW